jgi:hypothetical protein
VDAHDAIPARWAGLSVKAAVIRGGGKNEFAFPNSTFYRRIDQLVFFFKSKRY